MTILTPRELEIGALVMQGKTNREIAKALGCTEPTVKTHMQGIFRKLGIRSRVALAVYLWGLPADNGVTP